MSDMNTLGHWIKRRRRELDLNQERLAEQANCSVSLVQKIETGQRRPSRTLADCLARALDLPPAEHAQFIQLARQQADTSLPADRTATPPVSVFNLVDTLPTSLTPLVGRANELQAARAMLLHPATRLLTVSGPGGVGKTRLAAHLTHTVRDTFSDGVVWVALAPLREATAVLPTIAHAVGISSATDQDIQTVLSAALRARSLLLVLDNCEHVRQAAPLLLSLLIACPHLKLLVTSRVVLRVRGEHEFPVPPLAVPDLAQGVAPDQLAQYAAVALLLQRIQAVRPGFVLTAENASDLAHICVRLDGLPLALELAAIRLTLLSPAVLLQRLDQRLALLTEGYRDLYPHQQSLRALFGWSYDLLTPTEQMLFRHLAVFAGGATLEAIEAICQHIPPRALLEPLQALRDASLLEQRDHEGTARLVMLETVREFALEQLIAQGEEADLFDRHAHYYAAQAQQVSAAHLALEQANLRAALHWAVTQGDAALALRLGSAIWQLWQHPLPSTADAHGLMAAPTPDTSAVAGVLSAPAEGQPTRPLAAVVRSLPLIGRASELDYLLGHVQPILAGQPAGVLTISGPAGIGKSRLVDELRHVLGHEYHLRWFACAASEHYTPALGPLRHLLSTYFLHDAQQSRAANRERLTALLDTLRDRLDTIASDTALRLAADLERLHPFLAGLVGLSWESAPASTLEPAQRFEQMLLAVATLLHAESLCQPVVLHVDDIHWLDHDTRTALPLLARHLRDAPVALLCTRRTGSAAGPDIDFAPTMRQASLTLRPLSTPAIHDYATRLVGEPVSDDLMQMLVAQSGGNPFFLEHVLLDLHERGHLTGAAHTSSTAPRLILTTPPQREREAVRDIKTILQARLHRLSAQAQAIIQTAAVLGRSFEIEVLTHMLRQDTTLPPVDLANQDTWIWMTMEDLRGLFRHPLLHEVAYQASTQAQTQELHALAAAALEHLAADNLPVEMLAYHTGQAGDTPRERQYAWMAGEQAAAWYANADAIRHFSRVLALTSPDKVVERARVLLAREAVATHMGEQAVRQTDLEELAALTDHLTDPHDRFTILLRRIEYTADIGDLQYAATLADEAIVLAQQCEGPEYRAEAWMQKGMAAWRVAAYPAANAALQQGRDQAQAHGLTRLEALCLSGLANIAGEQGDHATEQLHAQHALARYRAIHDRRGEGAVLDNLGISAVEQGQYQEAKDWFAQALRCHQEIGYRSGAAFVLNNSASLLILLGDYEQARQQCEDALQLFHELGQRTGETATRTNLSTIMLEQGDAALARQYAEQSLELARATGSRRDEIPPLGSLGAALLAQDELAAAADAFQTCLDLCHELGVTYELPQVQAGLAVVWLRQGDQGAALALVDEVLPVLIAESAPAVSDFCQVYRWCDEVLSACNDPRHEAVQAALKQHCSH